MLRWTPELDAQFQAVVAELGGLREATPSKIRALMQHPQLTNQQASALPCWEMRCGCMLCKPRALLL